MVRGKIDIAKIESTYGRNNTYRKRRPSLFKKAYELSILSASEVVLMTRHPTNGELCQFSYPKRPEDILTRFLTMHDDDRKVNGQEFRGRMVIPNKDNLIEKLQNCKIHDDTAAAEETSIGQGNSGGDNQSIQHSEVINPQDFPQQILDYQRFYITATPTTSEQLFDDYGEKLEVILSHIKERKMLQQQENEAAVMQTDALFANMQLQQQEEFPMHGQQGFILQQQGHNISLQQQWQPQSHYNIQLQQQWQPQAHDDIQLQQQWQPQTHDNIQLQQQWQPETHDNIQLQQQWQPHAHNMNNGHINPTGEQYFNQMELSTGPIPSDPLMPSQNNSWAWGSTYNTAGPSHYFHQQSFEDDANRGPDLGQYNDELNFD